MIGMMPQHKKIAALILGDVKPSGEVTESSGPEVSGCEACAEAVLAAMKAGDASAFAAAMRDLVVTIVAEEEMKEG